MGTKRFNDIQELIGDDPEMVAFVERVVDDMKAASFLRDLSERLDTEGHADDASECRRIAKRLDARR